jgi:hypothetical protein
MAGWGRIVELYIAVAGRFERRLGPAQLLVLHLQLDLIHAPFAQRLLPGFR